MSSLTINPKWNTEINQVENGEPITGGSLGNANIASRQLGENVFYLKQKVENDLLSKADKSDVYSKTETDNNFAKKSTTVSGYGITDAYTKSQIDNLVNSKTGDLTTLKTTDKTQIVKSINEVFDKTKDVVALYDKNVEAGARANGWTDLLVQTWSGRTQESKNKDTVSVLDFGIIPDSLEDQTAKFDAFFNYIRANKVKGTAPAGTYIVSPTKQKTFGSAANGDIEVVNYCIDISGIDFEGALGGYRNSQGTIFKINPLSTDTNAVLMLQAQQTAALVMYSIKGVAFRNAPTCLRMTYAVHCNIDNVYADSTCKDFIVLGELTFASGPLFNKISNANCSVLGKPLVMQGKSWCNANIFENFYLSGGKPSSINVTEGYGAIANIFVGGEFASTAAGSHGIVLGRVSATSFYGTYFEPQGHAIVFDGLSRGTLLSNCTYGTTNSSKTEGTYPSILHHRGLFNAEVIIDGGILFFNASDPQQANMRMLSTVNASQVSLHVPKSPSLGGGDPSYKLIDPAVLRNLRVFRGLYNATQPLEFSSAGGSISNLPDTSKMDIHISGGSCTVSFRLDMSSTATYGDGVYYLVLPRKPSQTSNVRKYGVLTAYDVAGITENLLGYVYPTAVGSLVSNIQKLSAVSEFDDVAKTVKTTIENRIVELDRNFIQSLGNGGYVDGTLTYPI